MKIDYRFTPSLWSASKIWRAANGLALPINEPLVHAQRLTEANKLIQRTLQSVLPGGYERQSDSQAQKGDLAGDASRRSVMHDINPPPQSWDDAGTDTKSRTTYVPNPDKESAVSIDELDASQPSFVHSEKRTPRFISASYSNDAGRRDYKLYIPSSYQGQALPLIVMLHGCTQGPDDFALGTGMNLIAEQEHCFVVYPVQNQGANNSKCWNWFKSIDQKRDQGEPSIIAGITRDIVAQYHINPGCVFIAGMSAGGAMAAIMAEGYPDIYAAVGIHSGLPVGVASDLPSALAAMRGAARVTKRLDASTSVPVIVFHGDQDHTVSSKNANSIIARYLEGQPTNSTTAVQDQGTSQQGRQYARVRYYDKSAMLDNAKLAPEPGAEQWTLYGSGHTWSGGNSAGSYTDPSGPDASREMLRFFLSRQLSK